LADFLQRLEDEAAMLRMQEEGRGDDGCGDDGDDDEVDDEEGGEEEEEGGQEEGGGDAGAEGGEEKKKGVKKKKKKKIMVDGAAVQGEGGAEQATVGSGRQSAAVKRTIQKAVHIHEDDEFASSDSDEVRVRCAHINRFEWIHLQKMAGTLDDGKHSRLSTNPMIS
jgi:hypothetical protein